VFGRPLSPHPSSSTARAIVFAASLAIAIFSPNRFAGSWNDGSRLATVECLIDYHTLAIDRSIYVQVPADKTPYSAEDPALALYGTGDKLLIHGHYYSDKSPVPALLMAGLYQFLQSTTGLTARESPECFAYAMTLGTSGLAYMIAVWCICEMAGVLGLVVSLRLLLTASFGMCTVALAYTRHVNNHLLLLGITAALLLALVRLAEGTNRERTSSWSLAIMGSLAGLAYTVDLGAGPVLLLCTLGLITYRCRDARCIALFLLTASPWLALHHGVNYAVGGTFKPANAVPEYFQWPGCSFSSQNLTGSWNHANLGHFLTYAAALLVGKRGFLGHNLPLFLALAALVGLGVRGLLVLRRPKAGVNHAPALEASRATHLPELLYAACCCGGIWLLYALTSNNYSGQCCSIRWFLPMLAPAYYMLAVLLREHPRFTWVFLVLSGWGAVLGGMMWYVGPWPRNMVPLYWPVQGAAVLSLILIGIWRQKHLARSSNDREPKSRLRAA
jgi:hypothetical protein